VDDRERDTLTKSREEKKHEKKEHLFVLITENQCVYWAIRTEYLRLIIVLKALPRHRLLVIGLSLRRLRQRTQLSPWEVCSGQRHAGKGITLRASIFSCQCHSTCAPNLILPKETTGEAWELSKKKSSFGNRGNWVQNAFIFN